MKKTNNMESALDRTRRISVIIPSYKPGDYLWECLDSVCNQSLRQTEYEVILVLNGCDEPWSTSIKDYIAGKSANIIFIQTDMAGVSNARNAALDIARGEFITFIDDDDYVSPLYLEKLLEAASADTISLCYAYSFHDGHKEQVSYSYTTEYDKFADKGRQSAFNIRKYYAGSCLKLIHRDIIGDRRFNVNFKNGEDSLFMFLISDRFKYVQFTDKDACYFRRIRNESAFHRKQNFKERLANSAKWIRCLCGYYFINPSAYNTKFFVTRILGSIKGAVCR